MGVTTLKLGGRNTVVPKRRYEQLTRAEQDQKDSAIAAKAMADIRSGKVKPIPLADAIRKWGV